MYHYLHKDNNLTGMIWVVVGLGESAYL